MKAQEGKPAAMMLIIALLLLVSYLTYIFLIHPWDRRALLTKQANLTVSITDCNSSIPISGAIVKVLDYDGVELINKVTNSDGVINGNFWPDCYVINYGVGSVSNNSVVCLDSGENRVFSACLNYPLANNSLLLVEPYVGFIGSGSNVIHKRDFGSVILSFPYRYHIINYPSTSLLSNVFWSEFFGLNVTNINNLTDKLVLSLFINNVKGTPRLIVSAGDSVLFKQRIVNGEVINISVPNGLFGENVSLTVRCAFSGLLFWSYQECDISNVSVSQHFALPVKPSQVINFSLTPFEVNSSIINLGFNTISASGGIDVLINGVKVFNSNSLSDKHYNVVLNSSDLSLGDHNSLVFNAKPGTEVYINNVSLSFINPLINSGSAQYYFSVNDPTKPVFVNLYVNKVFSDGTLRVKVNDDYYVQGVTTNGWFSIKVLPSSLSNDNSLIIDALSGGFEVSDLRVNV